MQEPTLDVILRAIGTSDERLAADIRDTLGARAGCRAPPPCRWTSATSARAARGRLPAAMAVVDERLMALIARRRTKGTDSDDLSRSCSPRDRRGRAARPPRHAARRRRGDDGGSLAWALERLARAPKVFARVRAGDEEWIDAVIKKTLRIRPCSPSPLASRGAAARRRPGAAGRASTWRPHLPRAPPRGPLRCRAAWRPKRWLGAGRRGCVRVDPVRRGVRRCLGAAFATMEWPSSCASSPSGSTSPRRRARRAHAAPGHHVSGPRPARRAQRRFVGFFVVTVLVVGSAWRWPALSMARVKRCVP